MNDCSYEQSKGASMLLDDQKIIEIGNFFKVCSDPTRLKIILALRDREHSVTEIAELLGMSHSSISHQLRILRERRLVKYRREGKMVNYLLDDEHVERVIDMVVEHLNHE